MGCWVGAPEPDAERAMGICVGLGDCGFGVVLVGTAHVVLEEAIGCVVVDELEDALGWIGQVQQANSSSTSLRNLSDKPCFSTISLI